MSPDDRYHLIALKKSLGQLAPEEVGAPAHVVVFDQILAVSVFIVDWIRPHEVAEESGFGYFPEAVDLADIVELSGGVGTDLSS